MIGLPAVRGGVLVDTPRAGTVDAIDEIAAYARALQNDAVEFGGGVRAAVLQLSLCGSSTTARLGERLETQVRPGSQMLESSAAQTQRACEQYARAVHDVHRSADRIERAVTDALGQIEVSGADVQVICAELGIPYDYTWDSPPPSGLENAMPWQSAVTRVDRAVLLMRFGEHWWSAASAWRAALGEIERQQRQWRDLISERASAERQFVRALGDTAVGQLVRVSGHGGVATSAGLQHLIATRVSGEHHGARWSEPSSSVQHPILELLGMSDGNGESVWNDPPHPDGVAAAWNELSAEQRETLITEVPAVIGNLPGLPFAVRDRANRMRLEYWIAHSDELGDRGRSALIDVVRVVHPERTDPPVSLIALDLEHRVPRAAVGYGDLDRAESVTWQVPGMFSDADRALLDWDVASRNLYFSQSNALSKSGQTGVNTGLVAFLSYDTPHLASVLGERSARAGAVRLAHELDGAWATRNANVPIRIHGALGHSYGTTTLVNAAQTVEHPLDQLVLIASAGLDPKGLESFQDIGVALDEHGNPRVYTTLAHADKVAPFGAGSSRRLQPNFAAISTPSLLIGGSYSFSSDGNGALKAVGSHAIVNSRGTGYFDRDTQSLNSTAALTIGEVELVTGGVEAISENDLRRFVPPELIRQGGS